MRVIDRSLRFGFPCIIGALIIGKDTDQMDILQIAKHVFRGVDQFATKDKMQTLGHAVLLSGWARSYSGKPAGQARRVRFSVAQWSSGAGAAPIIRSARRASICKRGHVQTRQAPNHCPIRPRCRHLPDCRNASAHRPGYAREQSALHGHPDAKETRRVSTANLLRPAHPAESRGECLHARTRNI